ncbi:MAG: hypothetical protein SH821_15925 [Phototrophicales bacterium]|nr:hypothetical protein [Phototrophicales bacterium]
MSQPNSILEETLIQRIHLLDESAQQQVLEYVSQLVVRPEGTRGEDAIRIAQKINFDPESLHEMEQSIDDMFEGETIIEDVNLDE